MGKVLPSSESPQEQARALVAQKERIEAEIRDQTSTLTANGCDMRSSLVDAEGFPRADIDIYVVRGARVRIIELRNDLNAVMTAIGKALENVFDPTVAGSSTQTFGAAGDSSSDRPFARVDGVSPGSPAADAVCDVHF
jgi:26S proteasome non-ATPase regulatory subunit 9